jgi:hypothetical protein
VRISDGQTFNVPTKLHLVLKAAGPTHTFSGVRVSINGQVVLDEGGASPLGAFAFPLVAHAGDVVTVDEPFPSPDSTPYVTGYLSE